MQKTLFDLLLNTRGGGYDASIRDDNFIPTSCVQSTLEYQAG
jgi:hypothetical protein